MKISTEFPPNYQQIRKAFKVDYRKVAFTFGNTLYNPNDVLIDEPFLAHERVHVRQQADYGSSQAWWDRYISDPQFRLRQEIEAHKAHYASAKKFIKDRNSLHNFLRDLAVFLSSDIYGNILSTVEAVKIIRA